MEAGHAEALKAIGFTELQIADAKRLADVSTAMAFNWQALLGLILQYGPAIVAAILQLFNLQPTPAPTPTPTPTPTT